MVSVELKINRYARHLRAANRLINYKQKCRKSELNATINTLQHISYLTRLCRSVVRNE